MEDVRPVLLDRLVKKGADASHVDCLLRALSKILSEDPNVDPAVATERLHYLGWQEIQVDYHTLQLALACLELSAGSDPDAFSQDESRRRAMRLREIDPAPVALGDL